MADLSEMWLFLMELGEHLTSNISAFEPTIKNSHSVQDDSHRAQIGSDLFLKGVHIMTLAQFMTVISRWITCAFQILTCGAFLNVSIQ